MNKRIVITGMSVNTPIGDTLPSFIDNLLAGKSAITRWSSVETDPIDAKIGGDLGHYDIKPKIKGYQNQIPECIFARAKKLANRFNLSVGISIQQAIEAYRNAGLLEHIPEEANNYATILAGHNLNELHTLQIYDILKEEPEFIPGLASLSMPDTNHIGVVTEILQSKGPAYSVGSACASGNAALKCAFDEMQLRSVPVALVLAPILDISQLILQALVIAGAISYQSFNDAPEQASRPYDIRREGFVPSHGAAAVVIEELHHAQERGAKICAEILGAGTASDGCHLPQPSATGQANLMQQVIKQCGIAPQDIDFVSAHATSTHLGDLTELRSIKNTFGKHAYKLKMNAPKSMLGHTCWSSALVELVAGVLQMQRGELHPSINIDELDPEADLDICRERTRHQINMMMNNSFGFGGLNAISIIKRFQE